jgi:6-phosphogluconolactonase
MEIHIYPNPHTLATAAASLILESARTSLAESELFSLVLSGGSTPALTYQQLTEQARNQVLDGSRFQVFWGDERCVPADHKESNYRMAREKMLDHLPIPTDNIHRIACDNDPQAGAIAYENLLRSLFPGQAFPAFDLVLLGIGDDGHTASIFPRTDILQEQHRWVAPVYVPKFESWRISLTLPALNAARKVIFLVTGEDKAAIVQKILEADDPSESYPAQLIQPSGDVIWLLDEQAGFLLNLN